MFCELPILLLVSFDLYCLLTLLIQLVTVHSLLDIQVIPDPIVKAVPAEGPNRAQFFVIFNQASDELDTVLANEDPSQWVLFSIGQTLNRNPVFRDVTLNFQQPALTFVDSISQLFINLKLYGTAMNDPLNVEFKAAVSIAKSSRFQ